MPAGLSAGGAAWDGQLLCQWPPRAVRDGAMGARTAGLLSCRRCSGHGPEPHAGTRTVCNSREGGGEIEKVSEENMQENLSHTKQGRREIGDPSGISSGGWLLLWGRLGAD